jgi:hypothetical protein
MPWSEAELCEAAHIRLVKSASCSGEGLPHRLVVPTYLPTLVVGRNVVDRSRDIHLNRHPEAGGFG